MAGDRPRYGLLVSALGAIVLAVSVFLPWYGVSFTADGLAFAQQAGDQAAAQFGNATLQSYMGEFHANLSSLAGHQFTALSAHQALKDLNVVLLLLAGVATVIALLALAGAGFSSASAPDGHRAPLRLAGVARFGGDGRGIAVARKPWFPQPVGCQAAERLVWALRLDARGLSTHSQTCLWTCCWEVGRHHRLIL